MRTPRWRPPPAPSGTCTGTDQNSTATEFPPGETTTGAGGPHDPGRGLRGPPGPALIPIWELLVAKCRVSLGLSPD